MPRGGDRGGRRPTLPSDQKAQNKTYRLPPATIESIKRLAESHNLSQADIIERAIADKVEKENQMSKFEIVSKSTGSNLGVWHGETAEAALINFVNGGLSDLCFSVQSQGAETDGECFKIFPSSLYLVKKIA